MALMVGHECQCIVSQVFDTKVNNVLKTITRCDYQKLGRMLLDKRNRTDCTHRGKYKWVQSRQKELKESDIEARRHRRARMERLGRYLSDGESGDSEIDDCSSGSLEPPTQLEMSHFFRFG